MSDTPTTDIPISELPAASSANEYDIFPGVQQGETKKFSLAIILSWLRQRLHFSSDSSIATVENTSTASRVYLAGMRFMREGILYEATTQINVGNTISPNVNCESVTVENVKQNALTFDNSPTEDSDNPVKSGGIYTALGNKQDEITASGILKGDGAGNVSAAVAGTDYGTYSLPSGGIPSSDMASAVQTSLGKADTAYQKPSAGIPSSDMASAVQTSLGKADTAYQKPSSGIPATDLASGVIPTVPSISTTAPAMDGTGAAGSTGLVSDAGHVHPSDTSKAGTEQLAKVLGSPAGVNVDTENYVIYDGQIYQATASFTAGVYPSTYLSYLTPIRDGGLNAVNKIASKEIELPLATVGSSHSQTARLIGQCTTLFGIPATNIYSFGIADAALSPASIMLAGSYLDGFYLATSQSCTLSSSVKIRIIYAR